MLLISGTGKLSGATALPIKNRPRIPTPDVTKEVVDRENRIAASVANMTNQISPGVTIMPHQLNSNHQSYISGDVPFVQVVLSPIQELDGTGSHNNTLHSGQPGTAALAQAVLSPGLGPVLGTPSVSLPMTVSQFTSLGLGPVTSSPLLARSAQGGSPKQVHATFMTHSKPPSPNVQREVLTEITQSDEERERNMSSRQSDGSNHSNDSKETKLADGSNSPTSSTKKSPEITPSTSESNEFLSLDLNISPTSITSTGSDDGYRSRKVSSTSQNTSSTPKRGEVYV